MTVERAVRLLAGIIVLVSLALAHWVSHGWLWLTAFVGLNLLQSAFTNWCPAMSFFHWIGLPYGVAPVKQQRFANSTHGA